MSTNPSTGASFERIRERLDASLPALVHPQWATRFPWLTQGTTTRGSDGADFDMGLFAGASPGHTVHDHWNRLMTGIGIGCAVHSRQVHEAEVRLHRSVELGLSLCEPCDGHVTDQPGVLLAVATADCAPVFIVSPSSRTVAVLHAGWRGAAVGVLEAGLTVLSDEVGARATDLHVHFGPAICGECYEVGPEVFHALAQPVPAEAAPIDLRQILAQRAASAGVPSEAITVSSHCTRCTDSDLYSHRGGDGGRQVGYVGILG